MDYLYTYQYITYIMLYLGERYGLRINMDNDITIM